MNLSAMKMVKKVTIPDRVAMETSLTAVEEVDLISSDHSSYSVVLV